MELFSALFVSLLAPASSAPVPIEEHRENPTSQPKAVVYYLHGKIVEDLGPRGVSPRYGAYDYPGILDAFRQAGFEVVSEIRPKDTAISVYADKLVTEIKQRIAGGTSPAEIMVVGASKGAVIASLVSTRLTNSDVRYVLLANCNDWVLREMKPRLTGKVRSIYEASDEIAGSCRRVAEQSPDLRSFEEIQLNTGLGHGIVYRPLKEWVNPALAWAKR